MLPEADIERIDFFALAPLPLRWNLFKADTV